LDFIRPLVILKTSKVLHLQNVDKITQQLAKGENVILLANHQTELDPQAISLLLEKTDPKLAEEMIFVAGHRVINDPLAVPFSKGRNLLCIYSKKYIENIPDLKAERQQHNQRTMSRMGQLLAEGGKCIYVAPSGGRDRRDFHGVVQVAPFDAQSIELFSLVAQRAGKPTHFYPLALATYHLLPPPDSIKQKLGESRYTQATSIHLAFGSEVDMDNFPGAENLDKKQKREARAKFIWDQVCQDYQIIKD
jgi:glycerol-3-phosphate O-acyltransferase